MAIRDFSTDSGSGVIGFSIDSDADIVNLPTTTAGSADPNCIYSKPVPQGSWALDLSAGEVYFLKSDDTWVSL